MSTVAYQIDNQVSAKGKTFGVSKKKVTFKFGFANKEALENGQVGANCRGSEHEIVFVWTLNSGKRHILVDGKEIHYSESGSNGWTSDRTFQHVFHLKSPGHGDVRCHLISLSPEQMKQLNIKQPFNLKVNDVSYFNMVKIFQLGTPAMMNRPQMHAPSNDGMHTRNTGYAGRNEGGHSAGYAGGGGMASQRRGDNPYASGASDNRAISQPKSDSLGGMHQQPLRREEDSLISFDSGPGPAVNMTNQRQVSAITIDTSSLTGQPSPLQQNGAMTPWQPSPQATGSGSAATYVSAPVVAPGWQVPPPAPPQQLPFGSPPPPGAAGYGYSAPIPPPIITYQQQGAVGASPAFTSPTGSMMSYGSAPGFAQPPPQQQQQQTPTFAQPPPQQQMYSGY